jgi:hypothetical protein
VEIFSPIITYCNTIVLKNLGNGCTKIIIRKLTDNKVMQVLWSSQLCGFIIPKIPFEKSNLIKNNLSLLFLSQNFNFNLPFGILNNIFLNVLCNN